MKIEFDYFSVPKQFLEPDSDPTIQHLIDQIAHCESYKAVKRIAEKYNVHYLVARSSLIEIMQKESTFSLYGICSHVFKENNWYVSQFILNCKQNLTQN
jgi:hypothetical protein